MRRTRLKRAIDLTVAGVALVATLPLQVVVGLLVRLKLGRPVFFRQLRPGLHGKSFTMCKFRTMLDAEIDRVDDAARMTPFGRLLRSTSIDELPTLWNVIKGDMSLVGPRPLLMQYLDRYTAAQTRRHDVRPGLTGLAQISGRNLLSWEAKFDLDIQYVDHHNLRMDGSILLKTVGCVLGRKGTAAIDQATTPEFMGTDLGSSRSA